MPAKKKPSKKSRAKKPVNRTKKSASAAPKTVVTAPAKAPEPTAAVARSVQQQWVLGVLALFVVLFAVVAIVNHHAAKPATDLTPEIQTNSPSPLKVVPGEDGGTSSMGASNALQPQATDLQQSQPTQPVGSPNLQAPSTPGARF